HRRPGRARLVQVVRPVGRSTWTRRARPGRAKPARRDAGSALLRPAPCKIIRPSQGTTEDRRHRITVTTDVRSCAWSEAMSAPLSQVSGDRGSVRHVLRLLSCIKALTCTDRITSDLGYRGYNLTN